MVELSLEQIAKAVDGKVVGNGSLVVHGMTSDSRSVEPGQIFAAIVGERVDGHDKVSEALTAGSVATICSKPVAGDYVLVKENKDFDLDPVIPALGKLAKYVRSLNNDLVVVGVTGSSGKTSTKDLIGQVLAGYAPTCAPVGSPNNELGLPQTILQAPDDTKYLVAEMGMRGLGHIAYLADIAKPDIAVVTNVGTAHIGEVGSVENIAKAKSELVQALSKNGIAVLNHDDPNVREMAKLTDAKVITYGLSGKADVRAENLNTLSDGSTSFTLVIEGNKVEIKLPLLGEHNVSNALAAASVGWTVGMTIGDIAKALSQVIAKSKWRMEVHHLPNEVTLINDAYNANPESMTAALKTLASFKTQGKRFAVLGAMHELGSDSVSAHNQIGRLVVRLNIEQLVVVGQMAKTLHLGAEQEGSWDGESVWFADFQGACDYICRRVNSHDVLLFKASRSEKFDELAKLVADQLIAKGE